MHSSQKRNPVAVVAEAVRRAESDLAGLPLSVEVRTLRQRVEAVKTVLLGFERDVPTLSAAQRGRLAAEAEALAEQVRDVRRSQADEAGSGVVAVGDAVTRVARSG